MSTNRNLTQSYQTATITYYRPKLIPRERRGMKLIVPCEPTCTAPVIAEFKLKYGMYNKGNFCHTDDISFSHSS